MPWAVENSVYLVKDLLLEEVGVVVNSQGTLIRILEAGVRHNLSAVRSSSSLVKAVADCIKELEWGPVIRLRLKEDRRGYDIYLHKRLVQGLSTVLPEPSLQIRFRMKVPNSQRGSIENTVSFEKYLDLTEALKHFRADEEWSKWPRAYPASASKDKNVSCDIILGWKETPKPKTIKMSLTHFGKSLFGKEVSKDLVLVAGNGSEVKCHRFILEGKSDELATLLSPHIGMRESGRVELKENSEEGLTRLVSHFYGLELSSGDLNFDVALELLQTSHKYKLSGLMGWLIQIILERGTGWFNPDGLLELYFYAKNLKASNDWKNIVDHSLQIMLSLTAEIQSCDGFKELTRTDPNSATQLVWKLLELEKKKETKRSNKRKRREE